MKPKPSTEIGRVSDSPLVAPSAIDRLLAQVRPEWQARNLIVRVETLLSVDPSSACQRLLNAAFWDLREKIVAAGLDIAGEVAERFKLPRVSQSEDVLEDYSNKNALDLSYRMGLLTRPEWRRLQRCYEIRRDLEHEDDQYEAEIEDVIYIFKNSIELVLARDFVTLLRVQDIKELVEAPELSRVSTHVAEDYQLAPAIRKQEILEHLIVVALDSKRPDIVRENAMELLRGLAPLTENTVLAQLGAFLEGRSGKGALKLVNGKVAAAAGAMPYLKRRLRSTLFGWLHERLEEIGPNWQKNGEHRKPLTDLEDCGGLISCPPEERAKLVLWMTVAYVGEEGGYGTYGSGRKVFYSNTAAPRIRRMFREAGSRLNADFEAVRQSRQLRRAQRHKDLNRRLETLAELVGSQAIPSKEDE